MIRPDCIEVYPDRAAWLQARRRLIPAVGAPIDEPIVLHRIGASDIGKLLGKSPHGGPWDVWLDKMGLGTPEPDTLDMQMGRRWERRVLEDYGEERGVWAHGPEWATSIAEAPSPTWRSNVIIRHAAHPWATCSPDGFGEEIGAGPGAPVWGIECKAVMDPGSAAGWEEETVIIEPGHDARWPCPLHFALQVYWSLAVTGLPFWDLAAILMSRRGRLVYHRFLADPELQDALLAQVGAWRQRHLVDGVEPEIDDSAAAWSYYASLPHEAPLREATPEEAALALQLHTVQRTCESALAQAHRLKNELGARLKDCRGVALGPPPGPRKRPPCIKWEGGGVQHKEAQPARTITVKPHLQIRGLTEEES